MSVYWRSVISNSPDVIWAHCLSSVWLGIAMFVVRVFSGSNLSFAEGGVQSTAMLICLVFMQALLIAYVFSTARKQKFKLIFALILFAIYILVEIGGEFAQLKTSSLLILLGLPFLCKLILALLVSAGFYPVTETQN